MAQSLNDRDLVTFREMLFANSSMVSTRLHCQGPGCRHKRGVKVEANLDKSQRSEKYTSATFFANSRIPTFIDARHAIAHNKVMIIDKETVITGSFDFTKAAEEKNAENLLIIESRELAGIYIGNWEKHREHSEVYEARD